MFRYIVIEGPIGVGKTSLARLLAKEFRARCILETPEENPFLSRFYEDRKKYAFQAQLFFLLTRFQQQQDITQIDLFNEVTISDYLFGKDRLFALLNLDENEFGLYEKIFHLLGGRIPTPDLVIFLQAKPEVLLKRIKSRNVSYEKGIELDYLERLAEAYNDFFFHYNQSPLLIINTSEIDFIKRKEDFDQLLHEIRAMKKGTWYFTPLGKHR